MIKENPGKEYQQWTVLALKKSNRFDTVQLKKVTWVAYEVCTLNL